MTLAERPVQAQDAERDLLVDIDQRLRAGEQIRLVTEDDETADLPASLRTVIMIAAHEFAKGNRVSVVPLGAELTTRHAAELLNISRPYLVRLLDAGVIPYRMVGTHRRLGLDDVMAYRESRGRMRREGLRRLAAQTETDGLYVD